MTDETPHPSPFHLNLQSNLLAGLLTITPLVIVWVVFDFFLGALSAAGRPIAIGLVAFIDRNFPAATPWLADPVVQWILAVLVALLVLYSIGAVASWVIGQRFIDFLERLIERIPGVQTVYTASKKLVGVLRQKPDGGSRVVLIEFPTAGMQAIGFLMRTFTDTTTGQLLAAVYVPTAPNPTSGYLEICPMDKMVSTNMTMDQAMTMILSGGATAPDKIATGPIKLPAPKPTGR
jgi:uncharacterized membrane protein